MAKRKGRQKPTAAVIIPYKQSKGKEAIEIYKRTKRKPHEWQKLLTKDLMARRGKLWTHSKFGYSVSRRNGKNEIVAIRELWGLDNGEQILHTAHRTSTSHAAWERLCQLLAEAGYIEGEDFKSYKQFGFESITMLKTRGRINFRTRSSKGGLGEGYDLLVIDEAQEYTDDQESALKYVISASPNPQTIMCGTPPTPVSSGTVFTKYRKAVLGGCKNSWGWAEWSVEEQSDPYDKDLWYETNPSLGLTLTERAIQDEIGPDEIDFNVQRLGLWLKYNQKSAISKIEWEELQVEALPKLKGSLCIGIKYGHDGKHVALSVAVKTEDDRIFVEVVDCRDIRAGTDWIIAFLKQSKHVASVAIDGANGQALLAKEMKDVKLKEPILPTVRDFIAANAEFERGIYSKRLCHADQPSLTQCVSNCEKRSIGANGGFGYRALQEGIEIALMDSAILAYWQVNKLKEVKPQRISY